MYSLPITTYSDYWRRTKQWSSYLGGLAVFAAGTRYSSLEVPDISQSIKLYTLQTEQLSSMKIDSELMNERGQLMLTSEADYGTIQGLANRPREKLVSRGVGNLDSNNQELGKRDLDTEAEGTPIYRDVSFKNSQDGDIQEVSSQISSDLARTDEGNGDGATTSIKVLETVIPFETQYIESEKLLPGMSQTQEKGEEGILRQVIKTLEVDGQPVDQQVKSSYELKTPKKEVIIQNSKPILNKIIIAQIPKPADQEIEPIDLKNLKISKTLNVEATAYTYTGNKTATGIQPREGLIAVDPKVIAMGSQVYVEGYGYAIAADTGGAILGNRIDVFFGTLRQCIDWGRKPVRIHILNSI